jgi:hypothetical protein
LDPKDPKNYMFLGAVGGIVVFALLVMFFDQQHEITWKEFINKYLQRGLVGIVDQFSKLRLVTLIVRRCLRVRIMAIKNSYNFAFFGGWVDSNSFLSKLPCRFYSICLHIRNRETLGYLLLAGDNDNPCRLNTVRLCPIKLAKICEK